MIRLVFASIDPSLLNRKASLLFFFSHLEAEFRNLLYILVLSSVQ